MATSADDRTAPSDPAPPALGQDARVQGYRADRMTETDIDRAFPAHLATIAARADDALAACGFDALAIFSGRPAYHFLDDFGWPVQGQSAFQALGPAHRCARELRLPRAGPPPDALLLPAGGLLAPPAASCQRRSGSQIRRARPSASPAKARAVLAGALGRAPRTVFIGEWHPEFADWGFAARQPARAARASALLARGQDRVRDRMHARGVATRVRGRTWRRATRSAPAPRNTRCTLRYLRGERPDRGGAAVREHHRAQRERARRSTTTTTTGERDEPRPLVPDRRRRAVQRLRVRHHAHVLGRRRSSSA